MTMTIQQMEASVISIREMAAERDDLRERVAKLTDENGILKRDLADARQLGEQWRSERDHIMRAQAELMAQATSAAAILNDAATRAAHGGFRPNGAVPHGNGNGEGEDHRPSPQFLHKPLDETLREERDRGLR
jgi:hypothetical protein